MSQLQLFQFDFDKADTDKSGTLTYNEIYNILQQQGFNGTRNEAMLIFEGMDTDGNKSISRAEFSEAIKNLPEIDSLEFQLRKAFKVLDKDNSKFLTYAEIKASFNTPNLPPGIKIDNYKAFQLLSAHANDADGKMSYEEFLSAFKTEILSDRMQRIFARIDTDKSGFLTRDEMFTALKSDRELKTTIDKITKLIQALETDADGKISFQEFLKVWMSSK